MTGHVIVGAGAGGLYTAYRLLSGGTLRQGDTVQLYEMSERPGGRINTFTFPSSVYPEGRTPNGLYAEAGGMRFAVDQGFPSRIVEGHVLVQNAIVAMGLADLVVDFDESPQRMYHLRGTTVWEDSLSNLSALEALPYRFDDGFIDFVTQRSVPTPYTADNLLGSIASVFAPGLGSGNADRPRWCDYYARATVGTSAATTAFPAGTPIRDVGYMLNSDPVRYYLESSIDQPAIKVLMVFDEAWWTSCPNAPQLVTPAGAPASQGVGGPSITDLPLRMVYYFGNNVPGGPGTQGGPYVLLASYDDMNYADFWRQLEQSGDFAVAPSLQEQPVTGPTEVPVASPMTAILIKQLAEMHGLTPDQIPTPTGVFFQDWGQDPYGAGYHGWSAHYDICKAMDRIRAPNAKILVGSTHRTYIVGSCYSFDQAWVEGAFCVAESVLQDFFELEPFAGVSGYTLICDAGSEDASLPLRTGSDPVSAPRQNRARR